MKSLLNDGKFSTFLPTVCFVLFVEHLDGAVFGFSVAAGSIGEIFGGSMAASQAVEWNNLNGQKIGIWKKLKKLAFLVQISINLDFIALWH